MSADALVAEKAEAGGAPPAAAAAEKAEAGGAAPAAAAAGTSMQSRTLERVLSGGEGPPGGTIITVASITLIGVAQPTLLSLPFGVAQLGWIAGFLILAAAGASAYLGACLLAEMHHAGGERRQRYRDLGAYILSPREWVGKFIASTQYTLSLALGPVNLVLAAQLAQAAALLYCPPAGTAGESAVCSVFTSYNKCAILLGVLMAVLSQAPSLAAVESLAVFFSLGTLFYVGTSVALLYTSGLPPPDFGLPPGSTTERAFNALNAIGILIFAFGDSIQPEVQATMRPYPPRGRTEKAMRKAVSLSYSIFTAVYFLVAATGYAAYGNAAPDNLLLAEGSPRGLVVTAQALCSVQLIVGAFLYQVVAYTAIERWACGKWPARTWQRRGPGCAGWLRGSPRGAAAKAVTRAGASSLPLTLIARVPIVVATAAIAVAIPSVTALLGLVGSVVLPFTTYIFPAVLYAHFQPDLSRARRNALYAFAAAWGAVALAAAVGAIWSVVQTISDAHF